MYAARHSVYRDLLGHVTKKGNREVSHGFGPLLLFSLILIAVSAVVMGQPVGNEFPVNTYFSGQQAVPDIAMDAVGNVVVVWQSDGQDGDGLGIFGQRFDAVGNPLGGEFQVNAYTPGDQAFPVVASDANGNFVVVWQSDGQDGDGLGVFGRRYDLFGNQFGVEFQVNTYTTGDQRHPDVASDANGNIIIGQNVKAGKQQVRADVVELVDAALGGKTPPPVTFGTSSVDGESPNDADG